jgi:hypothetical protein
MSTRVAIADRIRSSSDAIKEMVQGWGSTFSESPLSPSFSMGRAGLEENTRMSADRNTLKPTSPLEVVLLKEQELEPLANVVFKGVPHKLLFLDKPSFIERIKNGNYDAMFFGYGTTVRDLDSLSILFHSQSMHNFARLREPKMDSLLEGAWSEQNPSKKMNAISSVLSENRRQRWYIPIAHSPLLFAISEKLESASTTTGDHIMTSSNLDLGGIRWKVE